MQVIVLKLVLTGKEVQNSDNGGREPRLRQFFQGKLQHIFYNPLARMKAKKKENLYSFFIETIRNQQIMIVPLR